MKKKKNKNNSVGKVDKEIRALEKERAAVNKEVSKDFKKKGFFGKVGAVISAKRKLGHIDERIRMKKEGLRDEERIKSINTKLRLSEAEEKVRLRREKLAIQGMISLEESPQVRPINVDDIFG